MRWFYVKTGQRKGPVEEAEFRSLVDSGVVHARTLVWRTGMQKWVKFGELYPSGLQPPKPPVAPAPEVTEPRLLAPAVEPAEAPPPAAVVKLPVPEAQPATASQREHGVAFLKRRAFFGAWAVGGVAAVVIAACAIVLPPKLRQYRSQRAEAEARANLVMIAAAMETFRAEHDAYTTDLKAVGAASILSGPGRFKYGFARPARVGFENLPEHDPARMTGDNVGWKPVDAEAGAIEFERLVAQWCPDCSAERSRFKLAAIRIGPEGPEVWVIDETRIPRRLEVPEPAEARREPAIHDSGQGSGSESLPAPVADDDRATGGGLTIQLGGSPPGPKPVRNDGAQR